MGKSVNVQAVTIWRLIDYISVSFLKRVWPTPVRTEDGASQDRLRSGDMSASVALALRETGVSTVRTVYMPVTFQDFA